MFPGINPRQLQKAMQKMGIQQEDIDAKEVIIRTADKELVFQNPEVARVNMAGQESYQVIGRAIERPLGKDPEINEDDIATVMSQAGCAREEALAAIKRHNGNLAAAIMDMKR